MGTFLAFVCGLAVGLVFCAWQRYQVNRELWKMLSLFPQGIDEKSAFSVISRLRRAIKLLIHYLREVEEREQALKEALEKSPIAYLQVDSHNFLLDCNQRARQLFRVASWPLENPRPLIQVVLSYDLDDLVQKTRESQQAQVKEWVFESSHIGEEAKPLPILIPLKGFSFPLSEGQIAVFLQNQTTLLELREARDRAFSDLTHELRTPLTSIRLVAEALETRLGPPEKNWVVQMLKETNRLIEFIQGCLDISQLQANPEKVLKYEKVTLEELIWEAWNTVEPLAREKEVSLSYSEQESESITVTVDPVKFTQVFLNLFDNAIEYTQRNSLIFVRVKTIQRESLCDVASELEENLEENLAWTVIEVIDSGKGFDEKDMAHVFERLYRGEPSRLKNSLSKLEISPTKGTGLGLAIVQQIVLAHGGSVTAHNSPETKGAMVTIKLPVTPPNLLIES